jgi:hypothetical protein
MILGQTWLLSLLSLTLAIANYYMTTFSVWFGHWFAHVPRSPTRRFHVDGHHAIYPSSTQSRGASDAYQGGKGGTNSVWSLLPWLLLQVSIEALVLPRWAFALCFLETALLLTAINYVHEQFHLVGSPLERFEWFVRARDVHAIHHDLPANLMVADHLWDRVFGTFTPAAGAAGVSGGDVLRPDGVMTRTSSRGNGGND